MLWSKLFIPTLRDPSAAILQRAGYIRDSVRLSLGQRSINRLAAWLRFEAQQRGGQEMFGSLVSAAPGEIRSYKQLPQLWFQQTGNTFEVLAIECPLDFADRSLERCGISYLKTESQYAALAESGGQQVAYCQEGGFCASVDLGYAVPQPPLVPDPEQGQPCERFYTPNQRTIADLVAFTGLPATSHIKSLVLMAGGKLHLVLLRGDHQLSFAKFEAATGTTNSRAATKDEICAALGANPGSLGPVGVTNLNAIADLALQGRRNMICGANADDYHLKNVTPGRDFTAEFLDLRQIAEGDMCPAFPGSISIRPAHELARFKTFHGIHVTNEAGQLVQLRVESWVFHLDRILLAAAEQQHDADGLTWKARSLAPFDVVITPASLEHLNTAQQILEDCVRLGLDAILDDRDERPGVKFKDADLVGIPVRITIGKKLASGLVELVTRFPKSTVDVPVGEAALRAKNV